ncbi:hypothetical protein [Paenibacillus humicus]|uniref:hypothetical protein n=1 Tax=Paenibacillus humicus TaxID=412861 RepID=UPI001FE40F8D|nr:hypothetical protein [Paenibacillus humicus]
MAKLTEIYHIYFRSKLFNGIILVFSLVTIVTFCSLGALVYSYSRDSVLGKERGLQAETAGSVSRYLDQRLDQAQDIMLTLYQNQPVLSDLLYCLRYDFPSYIQNRLNQYIASGGSEDRNIETYVRAQMKKKDDIRQIALYSRSQRFFFVFNSSNTQGISWISRDGDDVQRAIDAMRGSRTASSRTAGLNSILGLGSGDYTFLSISTIRIRCKMKAPCSSLTAPRAFETCCAAIPAPRWAPSSSSIRTGRCCSTPPASGMAAIRTCSRCSLPKGTPSSTGLPIRPPFGRREAICSSARSCRPPRWSGSTRGSSSSCSR